jgi:CubicO group peptidase (beta-lactamase class C family)
MMRPNVLIRGTAPLVVILASCGSPTTFGDAQPDGQGASYEYRIPEQTGDGWETASLRDVGLREDLLVRMMKDVLALPNHDIHSILVVRNGKLVFEEYFPGEKFSLAAYTGAYGFDREDTHNLASVTKSITTTLFGIALDEGYIESVHMPVFDYFPEYADLLAEEPRRRDITLEHLMLMTSGLRWNDDVVPYTDPQNDLIRMFRSADPIRYALSTPVYADPGTDFEYCNANTNILGEVVARAVSQRLDAYSATHLFGPLGIGAFEWQMISANVVFASGDLRLRPRDMAKIGLLFLNRGRWNGAPVISSDWVAAATARAVKPDGASSWADGYGYGWWHWDLRVGTHTHRVYMAAGWGGQWIIVSPEDDLVFVSTGGSYFDPTPMPADRLLVEYVLPAIQ